MQNPILGDCRGCISKHISTVTIQCFSWEVLPTDSLVRAPQLNCDFRTLPNISKHPRTAINCSLLGGDESWRPSASAALKLNCNYFQISTEFLVKSNAAVLSLQCLYLSFPFFVINWFSLSGERPLDTTQTRSVLLIEENSIQIIIIKVIGMDWMSCYYG